MGIRHCVRLRGHVVSQAPSGGGVHTHTHTHTHTADSLCRLCRELGRPWRQSPDTLVQGAAPARLEECPAIFHTVEGTSHLRTGVPFAHFPHPTCVLMWIPELMTWGLPPLLLRS